jgi:predicted patatin/cPLA2 family phospholipase
MSDTHTQTAREVWHILEQKRRGHSGIDTIGLVVQGGGMRGVYSMGALAALEEMGFGQCFDHVAGSSAGALNGAYFITGQASYGVETYIHYLSKKSFVNPLRLKKVVDIDYLVDYIGKKARPLHLHFPDRVDSCTNPVRDQPHAGH